MPTPSNITAEANLYNLADAADLVYYSPNSNDEEIRKKHDLYLPKGWIFLDESDASYEERGHRSAVYKVPSQKYDEDEQQDNIVRPDDEVVVIARGSEFKERFSPLNAYHDLRIGAGLHHDGEAAVQQYFESAYQKYKPFNPKRFIVTGQSLGGNEALAMLLKAQEKGWLKDVDGVGYFGPGTSWFNIRNLSPQQKKDLKKKFTRINVISDIVPYAPFVTRIGKDYLIKDPAIEKSASSTADVASTLAITGMAAPAMQVALERLTTTLAEALKDSAGNVGATVPIADFQPAATSIIQALINNPTTRYVSAVAATQIVVGSLTSLLPNVRGLIPAALRTVLPTGWEDSVKDLILTSTHLISIWRNSLSLQNMPAYLAALMTARSIPFAGHTTEPIKKLFRNSPILGNMDPVEFAKLGDMTEGNHQKHFEALMEVTAEQYEMWTPQQRKYVGKANTPLTEIVKLKSQIPRGDVGNSENSYISSFITQKVERALLRGNFADDVITLISNLERENSYFSRSKKNQSPTEDIGEKISAFLESHDQYYHLMRGYYQKERTLVLSALKNVGKQNSRNVKNYDDHRSKLSRKELEVELEFLNTQIRKTLHEELVEHQMLTEMLEEVKDKFEKRFNKINDQHENGGYETGSDSESEEPVTSTTLLQELDLLENAINSDSPYSIANLEQQLTRKYESLKANEVFSDDLKLIEEELKGKSQGNPHIELSTNILHDAMQNGDFPIEKTFDLLQAELKLIQYYVNMSPQTISERDAISNKTPLEKSTSSTIAELTKLKEKYLKAKQAYQEGLSTKKRIQGSTANALHKALNTTEEVNAQLRGQLEAAGQQLSYGQQLNLQQFDLNSQLREVDRNIAYLEYQRRSLNEHDSRQGSMFSQVQDALDQVNENLKELNDNITLMEGVFISGKDQLNSTVLTHTTAWLIEAQLAFDTQENKAEKDIGKLAEKYLNEWHRDIKPLFDDITRLENTGPFKQLVERLDKLIIDEQHKLKALKETSSETEEISEALEEIQETIKDERKTAKNYLRFIEKQLSGAALELEKTIKAVDTIFNRYVEQWKNEPPTNQAASKIVAELTELKNVLEKQLMAIQLKRHATNAEYSQLMLKAGQKSATPLISTATFLGSINLAVKDTQSNSATRFNPPEFGCSFLIDSIKFINDRHQTVIIKAEWEDNNQTKEGEIEIPIHRTGLTPAQLQRKYSAAKQRNFSGELITVAPFFNQRQESHLSKSKDDDIAAIRKMAQDVNPRLAPREKASNTVQDISGWSFLKIHGQKYRTEDGRFILVKQDLVNKKLDHIKLYEYQLAHLDTRNIDTLPANSTTKATIPVAPKNFKKPTRSIASSDFETRSYNTVKKIQSAQTDIENLTDPHSVSSISTHYAKEEKENSLSVTDLTNVKEFDLMAGYELIEEVEKDKRLGSRLIFYRETEGSRDSQGSKSVSEYIVLTQNQLKRANNTICSSLLDQLNRGLPAKLESNLKITIEPNERNRFEGMSTSAEFPLHIKKAGKSHTT